MALTSSNMLPLGTRIPAFRLPDTEGRSISSDDFSHSPALLVAFICNHCPYVKHIRSRFAELAKEFQNRGVAIVAINSNDADLSPGDAPVKMAEEVREIGYTFPYLYDESQDVARTFQAACTPDFFLFDQSRQLVYRGQFDDSRPGNQIPITGADLREAMERVLEARPMMVDQKPSIGCNIKWKAAKTA